VIEFYRTRTDTKMTIAAERLAVIAVITLPIKANQTMPHLPITQLGKQARADSISAEEPDRCDEAPAAPTLRRNLKPGQENPTSYPRP
jgi:hypothetical protein